MRDINPSIGVSGLYSSLNFVHNAFLFSLFNGSSLELYLKGIILSFQDSIQCNRHHLISPGDLFSFLKYPFKSIAIFICSCYLAGIIFAYSCNHVRKYNSCFKEAKLIKILHTILVINIIRQGCFNKRTMRK